MSYYPIYLDLEQKNVLVVGGGSVALRKVQALLDCGARITIISRKLNDKLKELVDFGTVHYLDASFKEESLSGVALVIAATDDPGLNRKISEDARERGVLINAVDQPSDCDFIVPATVKRGALVIAISTSGKSPALAGKIRKQLEEQFGEEYETLLILLGRLREDVLSRGFSQQENSRIFNEIVNSEILEALKANDYKRVEDIIKKVVPFEIELENLLLSF